jgi:hypothetical protein
MAQKRDTVAVSVYLQLSYLNEYIGSRVFYSPLDNNVIFPIIYEIFKYICDPETLIVLQLQKIINRITSEF